MPAFGLVFFKPGAPEAGACRNLFYIPDIAAGGEEKSPYVGGRG